MAPVAKKNKKLTKPAVKEIVVDKKENSKVVSGQLAKKLKKRKNRSKPAEGRGVVFIRHLPHGFFEDQLKRFFEQFGEVTRLRLARSERTGGSKGYAFVEFEFPEVAQIAAETMDNYLMFQRIVKAVYIPPEKQKYNYFKSSIRKVINKSGRELFVSGHTARMQKVLQKHNDWTDEVYKNRTDRQLEKIKKLKKKFANAGIDFESITYNPDSIEMDVGKPDSPTESENKGNILLVQKPKTRSTAKKSDEKTKKTKKEIDLKMLMEQSLKEEYTSDEDFEIDSDEIVKAVKNSKKPAKKSKKEIDLKMLLQKSLNDDEDSSDEEFVADEHEIDNDSDSEGSNEESYDIEFSKDSESDDNTSEDEQVSSKKSGNSVAKQSNLPKVNRLEQLISRKPHLGGIQKYSKKTLTGKKSAQTGNSKIKTQLKAAAVKELQKQGNIKEIKVADLKSKKNKKKTK